MRGVLSPLLCIGLELLLERRELGKGRIRIGRLVATVPRFAAALDVFRAQLGVTIRAIAIVAAGAFRTPLTLGTFSAIGALMIRAPLIGASLTMASRPAVLPLLRPLPGLGGRGRPAGSIARGRQGGPVGGSQRRDCPIRVFGARMRFLAHARRPPAAAGTVWAPQTPYFDE